MATSYPFDEFVRHFRDWNTIRKPEGSHIDSFVALYTYMSDAYPNAEEARQKTALFTQICTHLSRHREALDTGSLAVFAKESGLVTEPLLRALHKLFTDGSYEDERNGPSVDEILALANHYLAESTTPGR